jgi:hypothetical protein
MNDETPAERLAQIRRTQVEGGYIACGTEIAYLLERLEEAEDE